MINVGRKFLDGHLRQDQMVLSNWRNPAMVELRAADNGQTPNVE